VLVMDDHTGREPRAICPPVVHEVLRGARTPKLEKLLRDTLGAAYLLEAPMPLEVFEEAARLFRICQDRGITPGFADSLIAVCAIRNDVPLLTLDTDFQRIAEITPLRLFTRS
jgi:predicted nucleic acid-binding protein